MALASEQTNTLDRHISNHFDSSSSDANGLVDTRHLQDGLFISPKYGSPVSSGLVGSPPKTTTTVEVGNEPPSQVSGMRCVGISGVWAMPLRFGNEEPLLVVLVWILDASRDKS